MARLTSHAAPGRARLTRWPIARLKARALGTLYGWLSLDRVARPEVVDVAPELFQPRTGRRSLNAAFGQPGPLTTFGTGNPVHACGPICDPNHPSYRECFPEAYAATMAASRTAVEGDTQSC